MHPRVIPCLLINKGSLVKTVQFQEPVYVGDPRVAVRIFNDREVDELIVLDIGASREKREPSYGLIEEIVSEAFMPVAYGGGVSTCDVASRIVRLGVEKVVCNSAVRQNPMLVGELAAILGSQSLVVAIDAMPDDSGGFEVYDYLLRRRTGVQPATVARQVETLGAGELLINGVHREGTMTGYDLNLVRQVSSAVEIPVIACGGARSLEDLRLAITEAGASAAAAGSVFVFHGRNRAVLISYPDQIVLEGLFVATEKRP